MKSAYDLKIDEIFPTEGLGCVMLNTTSPVTKNKDELSSVVLNNEYFSEYPSRGYIKGIATNHHLTVRYGLLPFVQQAHMEWVKDRIDEGQDLIGKQLPISGIEVFSSMNGEEYDCVVAKIGITPLLKDLHDQFGVLPNLVTFPFSPHVTIGYFKKGFWEERGFYELPLRDEVFVTGWKFSEGKR